MHREIQIKQFPIVTTHWWPKTRNERFVWENEQYLYSFLPLVHNHVQVIWVRTRIRCVTCVRALWLTLHSHGASASTLDGGRVSQSDRLMQIPNPVHATPEKYVIGCCNYDGASAPPFRQPSIKRWRRRPCECSVSQSARTHTRHTPDACAHSDHLDMVVYKR